MERKEGVTIDTSPSEELTALAWTVLHRALEEPQLAAQLAPFEWYVHVVNNAKGETGRASQCFDPPEGAEGVGFDFKSWHMARCMMLQFRDIAAAAKSGPLMHAVALDMATELLQILTAGLKR